MKKFLFFLLFIPMLVNAELINNSKSAILIEPTTGKIIYEYNKDERLAPASMTKMMTLLLVMEAIDNGSISLDDQVNISDNAANMGGSQVYLEAGTSINLSELLKAVAVASGNDAAVALSEYVGGNVDNFVSMMNEKVNSLGLLNTHFNNVHGLDEDEHYSSAYDMSVIATELLKHSKILEYTSLYEDYLNKPDGSKIWLVNTNKLIRYYDGIDGLKTGYTVNAGYCLTATGIKNNLRLISVVMGSDSSQNRNEDIVSLMNYGFNNYKINNILKKGDIVDSVKVIKGIKSIVNIVASEDVNDLVKRNEKKDYKYDYDVLEVTAPVKVGDVIGVLNVLDNNDVLIKSINLTVDQDIKKENFFDLYFKIFKKIISGN